MIRQIFVTPDTDREYLTVYALSDDGSIWFISDPKQSGFTQARWSRLPPLPKAEGGEAQ